MIGYEENLIIIICDNCNARSFCSLSLDETLQSATKTLAAAKENGWVQTLGSNSSEHICPECFQRATEVPCFPYRLS